MSFLPPMIWMRAVATAAMPDSCSIERETLVPDGTGGTTATTTILGPFACRLTEDTAAPMERQEGGRIVAAMLWTAYLPAGTDVRPTDVLLIKGGRYEVADQDGARSQGAMVAVTLRRVV